MGGEAAVSPRSAVLASPQAAARPRERLWPVAFSAATSFTLVALVYLGGPELIADLRGSWPELLFWCALVSILNLLPVTVGELRLSLDMPVLIAVALLHPPPVAALVALLGSLDPRELRAEIALSRALFNRSQVAICVYLASMIFHALSPSVGVWQTAVPATVLGFVASYVVNILLVGTYAALRLGGRKTFASLVTTALSPRFSVPYLGYAVLGLVVARLYAEVGAWSVVTFLVPILVARALFIRTESLRTLARTLQDRERLLEGLFDRIVDERRDERERIAADLHDEALQSLTGVSMLARAAAGDARLGRPAAPGDLESLRRASDETVAKLRDVINHLQQSPLGRAGLVPTVRNLCRDLRLEWQVPIVVRVPTTVDVAPGLQVVAYQVLREALLNALKHAEAQRIEVRVERLPGQMRVVVVDDGRGMDRASPEPGRHFGLGLMRERIRRAGGSLRIEGNEGGGTRVIAAFPLGDADEDEGRGEARLLP